MDRDAPGYLIALLFFALLMAAYAMMDGFKKENELLKVKIKVLEAQVLKNENIETSPSN
jgi:hypothetical protein